MFVYVPIECCVYIHMTKYTHEHICTYTHTHIFRNKTIPKMANIRGTVHEQGIFGTQDLQQETDSIINSCIY